MITEFLLSGLFGVAGFFLDKLPTIEWTVETSAWSYASDILSMITYLLPWNTVRNIIAFIIALTFMRITISFIRTLWGFIPFV